jgi:hypothetical protein
MVAKLPSATRNMYVDGESSPIILSQSVPFPRRTVCLRQGTRGKIGIWEPGGMARV